MKTKAERKGRHLSAPRVRKGNANKTGASGEMIIKKNGKTYKVIKEGGKHYFVELKLTR